MSWEDNFRNYYDKKIKEITVPPNTITSGMAGNKEHVGLRLKLINSCSFAVAVILILTAFTCQPQETDMGKNIVSWYQERGGKEFFEQTMLDFKQMLRHAPLQSDSLPNRAPLLAANSLKELTDREDLSKPPGLAEQYN